MRSPHEPTVSGHAPPATPHEGAPQPSRHWHVGRNRPGSPPLTGPRCVADPGDAVRALGELISDWAGAEYERGDCERDPHAGYAAGLAEIFTGARCAEYGDEVHRVTRTGTRHRFGHDVFWASPVTGSADGCDVDA